MPKTINVSAVLHQATMLLTPAQERIDFEAWLIFVEPNLPAYVNDKAGPNSILLVSRRSSCAYFRDL